MVLEYRKALTCCVSGVIGRVRWGSPAVSGSLANTYADAETGSAVGSPAASSSAPAPQAEISDFPNHTHNDLFYDETLTSCYLELMRGKTGKRGGDSADRQAGSAAEDSAL